MSKQPSTPVKKHKKPSENSHPVDDKAPTNAGLKTIEWLYREQLRVDAEWSVTFSNGFTWWADHHAQTIEILNSETDESGETAYFISIRTDLLRNVALTGPALTPINPLLMCCASMAGPVYDEKAGTLSLCSLVRVHEAVRDWMSPLISMAALLQIAEARIIAPDLAKFLGAQSAESGHPVNGERPAPDELAGIVTTLIAPMGKMPSKWTQKEYKSAVEDHMIPPVCLLATSGGLGFTAEFPCGKSSSLFRATGSEHHPRYGNGLLLIQSFRIGDLAEEKAIRFALSLNTSELTNTPTGYGFGSYCHDAECIHFTTFLPNAVYRPGILPSFYYAAASRALAISQMLEKPGSLNAKCLRTRQVN
jgi:hypothetical protein